MAGGATVELTEQNFEDTLKKGGIFIIDFWAEWCGPCRAFAPVFEGAAKKHADVIFGKVDTEAQQELAGAFEIQAIPTLAIFRDGVLLFKESGALPAKALEELIQKTRELDMASIKAEIAAEEAKRKAEPKN